MTGGSTVALTPAGITAPGKSTYTIAGHTLLNPKTVDFFTTRPKTQNTSPGTARNGFTIRLANRVTEEGCCTVEAGTVIIDVNVRWPLNQPQTILDDAVKYLQALVNNSAFVSQVSSGVLPTT